MGRSAARSSERSGPRRSLSPHETGASWAEHRSRCWGWHEANGEGSMSDAERNIHVESLKRQLAEGVIDRREFLRFATLVGLSTGAAYAHVGGAVVGSAQAQA